METVNKTKKRNSILLKGCFVLVVALVLQIPVAMVKNLLYDRKQLSSQVMCDVANSWGGSMELTAPKLLIPVTETVNNKQEKVQRVIKSSEVSVDADVNSQLLHRSIYDIPVYSANITITGKIELNHNILNSCDGVIKLQLPLSKLKGMEGRPVVVVRGQEYDVRAQGDALVSELPYDVVAESKTLDYVIRVKSNGMDNIRFCPEGAIYEVNMKSNYASPGFKGDFLPVERTVSDTGFKARWVVTDLNIVAVSSRCFYVEFVIPAGQYQQSERAIKYSFLIILLVFMSIFLVESITRSKVNIVQYIVTGLSLCLFYLLLLSISEYLPFGWSYAIAATMTTAALGTYFYGFLKSKTAVAFTGAVACLYGFIYILLQMETGALLAGTIALFIILCVIMCFTRKNDIFDYPGTPVIE